MVPIIRLELEGMRHSMLMAFSEHQGILEDEVRAAVENYCTHENLSLIIQAEAKRCLDAAVKRAIGDYFSYGEGKESVKAAVLEMINKGESP
ncbi:hypothetical protein D3C85_726420 [compost metagenome]